MRNGRVSSVFRSLIGLSAVVGFGLVGCQARRVPVEPDYSGIRAKAHKVALASMTSQAAIVSPVRAEEVFIARSQDLLRRGGVEVVELAVWESAWRRSADDVGGIYDPSTGEVDEKKHAIVLDAVYRELVESHGIDAILHLEIHVVEHSGVRGVVNACGTVHSPYWPDTMLLARGYPMNLVRTACLVGHLRTPAGESLFDREAGIEGIETYASQTRAVVPEAEVLKDEVAIDRAVEIVLRPFVPPAKPPVTSTDPP